MNGERISQSNQTTKPRFRLLKKPSLRTRTIKYNVFAQNFALCTSQFQNRPSPPRAIPGHLTRVKLRTMGNLTQNEARPVGHLTFESKRLSAVGNKRISRFFDSAREPRSRVIALVDSKWVFLLLSVLYSYIVDYAFI